MTAPTTLKKLPGVLAFVRGHVVSDGEMFSEIAGNFAAHPIPVVRHGIRGTQNVNDGKGNENPGSNSPSNIQITETAKLDAAADALVVRFSLAMLDLADCLHSCTAANRDDGHAMRASVEDFVERAKPSAGIVEIARRYARNLANGRWLWRNRTLAGELTVTVHSKARNELLGEFDALKVPRDRFADYSEGEIRVADEIVAQMRGKSLDGLIVTARLVPRTPGAVEVFPSQNYVENKPVTRPLYKLGRPEDEGSDTRVMGRAALRDQKIYNAIRTIDTWYPAYGETGFPIAVEPLGASLEQQEFYRAGKASSFEMFKRLAQIDPDSEEGMFCIAALDRGGVYGESDKKEAS